MSKIRTGFVSNSSSSSFCILGASFENRGISDFECALEEAINVIEKDTPLSIRVQWGISDYGDDILLGIEPSNISEDSTIKEAKELAFKEINMVIEKYNEMRKEELKEDLDKGDLVEKISLEDISFCVDGGFEG